MHHNADRMIKIAGTFTDKVEVGSKLWLFGQKQAYTVRASNKFYSVCTKPFNARKTVIYTIIDWTNNINGTENLIFGLGAETDQECEDMLERLTNAESGISQRNWTQLKIDKVKLKL